VAALYLDTSAVLRTILETGTSPEVEASISNASRLLTSRLALVEASRATHRLRQLGQYGETQLADIEGKVEALWSRCELWELSRGVCDAAREVAPNKALRALDALHLATFVLARRRIPDLELLTVDERMRAAAEGY
jgi:predicted nucleic acid-binding protein